MTTSFDITGTTVTLDNLLMLQLLSADLQRLPALKISAKKIGEDRSVFRGQGREFVEMKQYQIGDDVRHIDWRLTAKKQTPYVRVMEEDRNKEHAIWLQLNSSSYFGTQRCFKSVMACYWTAFLIWRFTALKHPIRLIIDVGPHWHQELKISSTHTAARAMSVIVDAHVYLQQHFKALDEQPCTAPHRSGRPHLWLVGDFLQGDAMPASHHAFLGSVMSMTVLQTVDEFDSKMPDVGLLPVKEGDKTRWLQTSDEGAQQRHQAEFLNHQQQLQQTCWQRGGQFFSHQTNLFEWQDVRQWPLHH